MAIQRFGQRAPSSGFQIWWRFLFGFDGRIDRRKFILVQALCLGFLLLLLLPTNQGVRFSEASGIGPFDASTLSHLVRLLIALPVLAVFAVLCVVTVSSAVRRLHDIGLPGWLVLIPLLPIVTWLLFALALAILPGSKGSNRYGERPF